MVFGPLLLTDTIYSSLPADPPPSGRGQAGRRPRTSVAVEVQDLETGARHHWTRDKLRCCVWSCSLWERLGRL